MTEDFLKYSYGDEDNTDEGRTNEEMLEEMEKLAQMKFGAGSQSNCVLFNDEEDENGES